MRFLFSMLLLISLFFITTSCNNEQVEEKVFVYTEDFMYEQIYGQETRDASSSEVIIRYWDVTRPGIRKTTPPFDTLGKITNRYRLAYQHNDNLVTGSQLVDLMKTPIWYGQTFDKWVPNRNHASAYTTVYDTTTIVNEDGSWYWVIGYVNVPNPEYNPNWYSEYLASIDVFKQNIRDWFLIQEERQFPVIPGGPNYRWQLVYDYKLPTVRYVDIPAVEGKYNGQKVWVMSNKDCYNKIGDIAVMYQALPYWIGDAKFYVY